MKTIRVDNCRYCGAVTTIDVPDDYLVNIEYLIEDGDIYCWNCDDDKYYHAEFDIYENGKKVWCGHDVKCKDVTRRKNANRI